MNTRRIALMNIESYSSGLAIRRFIELEGENIDLVICSKKHLETGLIRAAIENYVRSGFRFTVFLFLNFHMYYWVSSICDAFDRLTHNSRPPRRIKNLCKRYNIPYITTSDVNEEAVKGELKSRGIDIVLIYYFEQILNSDTISIPPLGTINSHAAFLPSYRGLFPVFRATQFGEASAGITIHEIPDREIDAGPILDQQKIALPEKLDALSCSRHVNFHGVDLTRAVLRDLDELRKNKREQAGAASYFSFPTRADTAMCLENGRRVTSFWRFFGETVTSKATQD